VIHLTKQELRVLYILTVLLITGMAVRVYRTAHPPAQVGEPAKNTK
jgi:hypothetical protein